MRGCALRKVVRNLAHKNWKTGESNPSTSLHRSRDQRRPGGLRWAGGWQKHRAPRETQGRRVKKTAALMVVVSAASVSRLGS